MRPRLLAAVLVLSPCLAHANVETVRRTPSSSSIPCAGTLEEVRTWGSVMQNISAAVTLTCTVRGKTAWVLEASAGCGTGEEVPMPRGFCGGPRARPATDFVGSEFDARVQTYRLYRYVFAKDCTPTSVTKRSLAPVTNAVRASFPVQALVCREVNVVDATHGPGSADLPPSSWKPVSVRTDGPPLASSDETYAPSILGTSGNDYDYTLSWTRPGNAAPSP